MKLIVLCLVIQILFSCNTTDKQFSTVENLNKHELSILRYNLDSFLTEKSALNLGVFWELKKRISDSILYFKQHYSKESIPLNNWIFEFKDSSTVFCNYNSEATCGVGLTFFDTVIWNEKNNQVNLFIKHRQIGYEHVYVANSRYKKIVIDSNNFKLEFIKDL